MEIVEYIIKIIEILAWPVVALSGILIFKRDIHKIFKRVTKVETSAAKILFNEGLQEIEQELSKKPKQQISKESKNWLSEMKEIAKINPRAAIIEAWTAIEVKCIEKNMVQGSTIPRFSPKALEEYLYSIKEIDKSNIKYIMNLRQLRNRVAHGIEANFEYIDAEKYIELADKVLNALSLEE